MTNWDAVGAIGQCIGAAATFAAVGAALYTGWRDRRENARQLAEAAQRDDHRRLLAEGKEARALQSAIENAAEQRKRQSIRDGIVRLIEPWAEYGAAQDGVTRGHAEAKLRVQLAALPPTVAIRMRKKLGLPVSRLTVGAKMAEGWIDGVVNPTHDDVAAELGRDLARYAD